MNVLFISYWGINDPLTVSTVFPHLAILGSMKNIEKVIFVTIERHHDRATAGPEIQKITHIPLHSQNLKPGVINKINDFIQFPRRIAGLVKEHNIARIIARGAPAGSLAYLVQQKTKIPFYVESFEPHADYMKESGEWSGMGLKYLFEKHWERRQVRFAAGLMPVTDNYKKELVRAGVPENKIRVIPCCVSTKDFLFSEDARRTIRQKLNIPEDAATGIYLGKFGGLYYDEEAFRVFKESFSFFKDLRLIILSSNERSWIERKLKEVKIDRSKVFIGYARHSEVASYLSASDFAFTLIKPTAAMKYSSPIKNGEYWANGLPVLSTGNIGDDSSIIEAKNAGAVFSGETLTEPLEKIRGLFMESGHRQRIAAMAEAHRGFHIANKVYNEIHGA